MLEETGLDNFEKPEKWDSKLDFVENYFALGFIQKSD